jgi:hypothetical protein
MFDFDVVTGPTSAPLQTEVAKQAPGGDGNTPAQCKAEPRETTPPEKSGLGA